MAAERNLWAFTVLLALFLIGIDAAAPSGLNVAIFYVTLVLPSLWSRRKNFTYFVAAVATCLVLQGLFFSLDASLPVWWPIANRLLTVCVIWTTAFLCIQRQHGATAEAKAQLEHTQVLEENQQLRCAKASLEEKNRELAATKEVAVYTLAKLAESRDTETGQHLERIQVFSLILARQLRHDSAYAHTIDDAFLRNLYHASILHDIGKVGIKDEVLLKPGRFTPGEFESMKRHTLIGTNILEATIKHKQQTDFLEMAALIARCHHERFDGSGYPDGLSGIMIPLPARIVAVADVYDALISERPYKAAYSPREAQKMIVQESGCHFDPIVVQAFGQRFDVFVRVQLQCPNNKYVKIFDVTDSLIAEFCSFESDDPASDSPAPEAVAAGTSA
jgi:response regulator RpfG family c-di-GMP phosphodiesterase